jgi:cytochrome c biogenesis protein CcdA
VLGAIASLIGGLFGGISRTWYFIIGGVSIAIGLHLIGIYSLNIPIPVHLQPKRRGIIGALLLGALFGIVSSPCATPVLALILTFVASKGEVIYGTSLLFVYAIGHCALIFLAGTAAGFVENFVQSKGITNITNWSKRAGGVIVSLVGIYLFYLGITL